MSLFDVTKSEKELENLEEQTLKEHFWEDSNNSTKVLTQIKKLKAKCLWNSIGIL